MDTQIGPRITHRQTITGLWTRACEWVSRWTAVFSPEEIQRDGLSRRLALRCCAWLAPLEAAVRRLVIAAALAFDPAQLAPVGPKGPMAPARRPPSGKTAGRTSFRVFSLRPSQDPPGPPSPLRRRAAPPRHLPFPRDIVLPLGPPGRPAERPPSLRQPHPLIRQCRIFPNDPDYVQRAHRPNAAGSAPEPVARPDPHAVDRAFPTRRYAETAGEEWRRIDLEWERVLPAPGLAGRISALIRVVEDPNPLVRRVARRLVADPALAAMLRGLPAPQARRPAYDRLGPQVDEDLLPLCQSALDRPDTS